MVVTNEHSLTMEKLRDFIKRNGYPELYMPRMILYKDKIPMSATGKIDNVTLKKMVLEELSVSSAA